MPLVRITVARGPAPEFPRAVADAVHRALVETAGVPPDCRFQVLEEVAPEAMIWSPSYLGIERRGPLVLVQVFMNVGRTVPVKKALYGAIALRLAEAGVRKEDVLVNLVEIPRENWSFGGGVMSYPPPD